MVHNPVKISQCFRGACCFHHQAASRPYFLASLCLFLHGIFFRPEDGGSVFAQKTSIDFHQTTYNYIVENRTLWNYCQDNSVCIATDWMAGFDSQHGQDISLLHCVQTCRGAHPASYPVGTRGSFRGSKVVGA
jgi:hypothetical protein